MALNKILILYVMVHRNKLVYKAAISIINRLMQWDTTAEDWPMSEDTRVDN